MQSLLLSHLDSHMQGTGEDTGALPSRFTRIFYYLESAFPDNTFSVLDKSVIACVMSTGSEATVALI